MDYDDGRTHPDAEEEERIQRREQQAGARARQHMKQAVLDALSPEERAPMEQPDDNRR